MTFDPQSAPKKARPLLLLSRGAHVPGKQATVGAGLPVIATLKHLVDTGDRILRVEGVFSGTLSFIFNSLAPGRAFSDVVREVPDATLTLACACSSCEPQAFQVWVARQHLLWAVMCSLCGQTRVLPSSRWNDSTDEPACICRPRRWGTRSPTRATTWQAWTSRARSPSWPGATHAVRACSMSIPCRVMGP